MIKLVAIDSIRPDPNQPRKIFDQAHIEGLAKSLSVEGVINPIEVSPDMMIITGEQRWRAARFLKWTEVPVNINETVYSEYERLRRQMAENLHQSSTAEAALMNTMDVARAYARLFKLKSGRDWVGATVSRKETYGIIKEIAGEIGVSDQTIHDYLKRLGEPEFVQKDIERGRPKSFYVEAERIPIELREKVQRRIANNEFASSKDFRYGITVMKKLPELANLQQAQSQKNTEVNRILNGIARLALALEGIPLKEIDKKEQEILVGQLNWLKGKISIYKENYK